MDTPFRRYGTGFGSSSVFRGQGREASEGAFPREAWERGKRDNPFSVKNSPRFKRQPPFYPTRLHEVVAVQRQLASILRQAHMRVSILLRKIGSSGFFVVVYGLRPLGWEFRMCFGHGRPCACPLDHVHHLPHGGRQNALRANGPGICLAQPSGLGIRAPKHTKGPTARPFARVAQSQTYRSSTRRCATRLERA